METTSFLLSLSLSLLSLRLLQNCCSPPRSTRALFNNFPAAANISGKKPAKTPDVLFLPCTQWVRRQKGENIPIPLLVLFDFLLCGKGSRPHQEAKVACNVYRRKATLTANACDCSNNNNDNDGGKLQYNSFCHNNSKTATAATAPPSPSQINGIPPPPLPPSLCGVFLKGGRPAQGMKVGPFLPLSLLQSPVVRKGTPPLKDEERAERARAERAERELIRTARTKKDLSIRSVPQCVLCLVG